MKLCRTDDHDVAERPDVRTQALTVELLLVLACPKCMCRRGGERSGALPSAGFSSPPVHASCPELLRRTPQHRPEHKRGAEFRGGGCLPKVNVWIEAAYTAPPCSFLLPLASEPLSFPIWTSFRIM